MGGAVHGSEGCFALSGHYAGLDAKSAPLVKIDGALWNDFYRRLAAVW